MRIPDIIKNISLMGGALLVCLLAVEGGLQLVAPAPSPYTHFVWPPGQQKVFRPAPGVMPGVEGESHFTINAAGFRGTPFASGDARRYLVLGGSTTECLFLDDTETWPAVAERTLGPGVKVANVGKSGLNMRDHLMQVGPLLDQYGKLDGVILMAGVNDLLARLAQQDAYDPGFFDTPAGPRVHRKRAFAAIVDPDAEKRRPWYARLQLWKRVERGMAAMKAQREAEEKEVMVQDEAGNAYVRARRQRAATPETDLLPDLGTAVEEFRRNLNRFVDEAEKRHVPVIFVTQASLWRENMAPEEKALLWMGGKGNLRAANVREYYSPGALLRGLTLFNEAMLALCAERQVTCIDVAGVVPKEAGYFYDEVHFNEKGAALVGETVASALRAPSAP
ncbi:MAG: SGNH/GDSL hydrolase family protein [Nitrospinae bacterium]|nr:SGNH/GDSL hydrolase family protein [Nitrospinota bacterium]